MSERTTRPVGRPRVIASPDEMYRLTQEYVDLCEGEEGEARRPVLLTGLILHLGLSSRASLDEYKTYSPEFSNAVDMAKLYVQMGYEERIALGVPASGLTFVLKNMGWSDQQRLDIGNAGDKPFEVSDTQRAARLAGLVAIAKARQAQGDDQDDGEDLA